MLLVPNHGWANPLHHCSEFKIVLKAGQPPFAFTAGFSIIPVEIEYLDIVHALYTIATSPLALR